MVYVYILKNKNAKFYTGITSLSPEDRLVRHNNGEVFSTKFGKPWRIIYFEEASTMKEARKREKQIKSWHCGNAFKKLLFKAAGSANGRPMDSESMNLGSIPSPAALNRK